MLRKITQKTAFIKPFSIIYKRIYVFAVFILKKSIMFFFKVESIYLQWGLDSKDTVPGISDLDFIIIIKRDSHEKNFILTIRFIKFYYLLKKFFPFLGFVLVTPETEINDWLECGDIRVCELLYKYKPIYGRQLPMNKYKYIPEKFKIDSISQAFFSGYSPLLQLYLKSTDKGININVARNMLKFLIDSFRYCHYVDRGRPIIFKTRTDFLDYFKGTQSIPLSLINEAYRIYDSNYRTMSENFVLNALSNLFVYLNKICERYKDCLEHPNNYSDLYEVQLSQDNNGANTINDYQKTIFSVMTEEISSTFPNYLEKIFYFDGRLYFFLNQDIDIEKLRRIYNRSKEIFSKYKKIIPRYLEFEITTEPIHSLVKYSNRYRKHNYFKTKIELFGLSDMEKSYYLSKPILIEYAKYLRLEITSNNHLLDKKYLSDICFRCLPWLLIILSGKRRTIEIKNLNTYFCNDYPDLYIQQRKLETSFALQSRKNDLRINMSLYLFSQEMLDKIDLIISKGITGEK